MKKKKKTIQKESSISKYVDIARQVSLYSFFVVIVVGALFFFSSSLDIHSKRLAGVKHENQIKLPEATLDIEIADTKERLEMGLSNRTSLGEKEGMLFVFSSMGEYSFWMKDMNFPLDIVWISDEGRVVSISSDVATSTYPKKIFKNDAYAKYVLEMNAGTARKFGLFLGTSVGLPSGLAK